MTGRERKVAADKSVREARTQFADVLNDASAQGLITYITTRGRRIAAVVPVWVADEVVAAAKSERPPTDPSGL
jgi:prevent-host-death family protein